MMTTIKLRCDGQTATARAEGPLVEGTANIPVEIILDGYDDYAPKLVAKCGTETRDMVISYDDGGMRSEVPHECLRAGQELKIGIDAFAQEGSGRMPSMWAKVGKVDPSPAGEEPQHSVPPTPELVDQILTQAGRAEQKAESALTDAREAIRKADEVSGTAEEAKTDAEAAKRTAENVAGSVQTLLSAYDTGGIVTGTTMKKVAGGIELRVEYKGKSYTMTADGFAMEAEVRQMISTIPKFKIEVVQSLPESDIDTSTLYLVPADPRQKDDVYTEWIYAGGKWEKLGTQSVDLSEYARKDEIPEPYDDSEIKREQRKIKDDLTLLETAVNGKYTKPESGVPETDLDAAVRQKLNSGGGGGEEFAKIASVTTDESVSSISIDSDNGKPMSLRSAIVVLKMVDAPSVAYNYLYAYNGYTRIALATLTTGGSGTRYNMARIDLRNDGINEVVWNNAVSAMDGSQLLRSSDFVARTNTPITRLLFSGRTYPAGTQVDVYGVRA